MQIMAQHNISSAPVRAPNSTYEYLGFVDFVDIVCFVVSIVKQELKQYHGQQLMKLLFQEKLFHEQHIGAIVGKLSLFFSVLSSFIFFRFSFIRYVEKKYILAS
jgi:hypothetical protein